MFVLSNRCVKLELLHFKEAEVNILLHFVLSQYNRASRKTPLTLFGIGRNCMGEACPKVDYISLPVKTHYISWAENRNQNRYIFRKCICGTFCSAYCDIDI